MLVAVNYAPAQGQCFVRLGGAFAGRRWELRDLLGEVRYEREIIATAAATRHAIELDLITSEEAGSVWRDVADRHPQAGWCRTGPELAA